MALTCPACSKTNLPDARFCAECGAPMPVTSSGIQLPNSTMLHNETYCIEAVLGRGGFGITYRASDVRLQMPVAVKEFCPPGCMRREKHIVPTVAWPAEMHAEGLKRFMQEGRTLARFHHPNIVRVLFMFEENGTGYLVMEMVEGETLEALLRRTGILMPRKVLELARRVGEALIEVHRGGLLHLDIKPSNIIHTANDRYVLVDFGTARQFVAMSARPQSVFLTPGYSPPEQYSERAPRTRASDVYSLAATLYHLLTGEMPPTAADRALGGGELQPLRSLNPMADVRMEQAIMRALILDTRDRTATMEEFLAELGTPAHVGAGDGDLGVGGSAGSGPVLQILSSGALPVLQFGGSGGLSVPQAGAPGVPPVVQAAASGTLVSPQAPASGSLVSGGVPVVPPASPPAPDQGGARLESGGSGVLAPPPWIARSGDGAGAAEGGGSSSGGGDAHASREMPSPWRRFAPFLFVALVLFLAFVLVERLAPGPRPPATPQGSTSPVVPPVRPASPSPAPPTPVASPASSPSAAPVASPSPAPVQASPSASPSVLPQSPLPGASPDASPSPRLFTQSAAVVECVAWSDDGTRLAAVDRSGTIRVWDAQPGPAKAVELAHIAHSGPVKSLSFSPNGLQLAGMATSGKNPLCIWDIAQGTTVRQLGGSRAGPPMAWSKDAKSVALVEDFELCLYDLGTGQRSARLGPADGLTVAFSADGSTLGGAFSSTVRLWRTEKGNFVRQLVAPSGGAVVALALSRDGRCVAVGAGDGSLLYWGPDDGGGTPSLNLAKVYTGSMVRVAIAPHGELVTADVRGVTVRDVKKGEILHRLDVPQGLVDFALSPDGARVALACKDGSVLVEDVEGWSLRR